MPEEDFDLNKMDPAWREKLNKSGGFGRGDIVLSKSQTQVPKGFKVVETIEEGADMGLAREYSGKKYKAVHVCKNPRDGDVDGFKYKLVPV